MLAKHFFHGSISFSKGKRLIHAIYIHVFYEQPSSYGSNDKNGLKNKQLAKQPPTLKTLLQIKCWLNSQ